MILKSIQSRDRAIKKAEKNADKEIGDFVERVCAFCKKKLRKKRDFEMLEVNGAIPLLGEGDIVFARSGRRSGEIYYLVILGNGLSLDLYDPCMGDAIVEGRVLKIYPYGGWEEYPQRILQEWHYGDDHERGIEHELGVYIHDAWGIVGNFLEDGFTKSRGKP